MENKRPFRLVWDSKIEAVSSPRSVALQEMQRVLVNPVFDNQEYFEWGSAYQPGEEAHQNIYYYGDNYELLQALISGPIKPEIDLIYIVIQMLFLENN